MSLINSCHGIDVLGPSSFPVPSSSSDEDVEKLVSTTHEVVRVQQPVDIKETRRFSETISIDHTKGQPTKPVAPRQTTPQRTEFFVRQTSLPRGMRMEVEVPVSRQVIEQKTIELKQQAEAITTQRQEMKIQLAAQRRFSETLAIDHRRQLTKIHQEPQKKVSTSTLTVKQKAALRGMKMNVEVPELKHTTHLDVMRKKQVDALETKRQELVMMLEGAPPRFLWNIQSQKVMDGEKVKFFTQVTGNPKPDVTWYHNGKVIIDNPDFHSVYNRPTGDCTLYIIEVFPQDTGTYECVAVNPYGRAETKAQLVVEGNLCLPFIFMEFTSIHSSLDFHLLHPVLLQSMNTCLTVKRLLLLISILPHPWMKLNFRRRLRNSWTTWRSCAKKSTRTQQQR